MPHVAANSLSSLKLMLSVDGSEIPERSQRIEFRVKANADAPMSEILKTAQL
jgi:hypothetical protein